MIKELKYLFFILIICFFFFFTLKYYFSDSNKKKSYRSLKETDYKIINFSKNLMILNSDTDNVTEYVQQNKKKNKKNFNFWKLTDTND